MSEQVEEAKPDNFEPLNQAEVDAVECEVLDESSGGADDPERGSRSTHAKSEFIGAEKCAGICIALSEVIAGRKGEKYKLRPEEAEQLGAALDPVLAKYMPASGEDIGAELGLALVALSIIMPRMQSGEK